MNVTFNLASELETALQDAAQTAGLEADALNTEVRTADPRHGDFQANGVLGYAKARKLNPRATAEQIVAALPEDLLARCEVSIAGPGFINFTFGADTLLDWLQKHDTVDHLKSGASAFYQGQRFVVDYS